MSRYTVTGPWDDEMRMGSYVVQSAQITDTHNGNTYEEGAYRVVDAERKPAVRGKGGTVPFYGESAWMSAERLASDLAMKEAYAR